MSAAAAAAVISWQSPVAAPALDSLVSDYKIITDIRTITLHPGSSV